MLKLCLIIILIAFNQLLINSFEIQSKFIQNSNNISLKLLNVLPKNQNNFYSPLCITYSLYALLNGANGLTKTELKNLLTIGGNETLESINGDIKPILDSIRDKNLNEVNEVITRFANRILVSDSYNLTEKFQNTVKNEFNSSVDSVDFLRNALNITDEINNYIKDQTNGKIDRLFESLSNDTVFLISNALYFSAGWEYPFDSYSTSNDLFYGSVGQPSNVEMMRMDRKLKYISVPQLNSSLIELPFIYESNTSMIILLPNERNGLNNLIEVLDSETLNNELNGLLNSGRTQLNISVPKFELETDYNLKTPLKNLGLTSLFEDTADLSLITGATNLKISQAIHKAVFKIKEQGVEAAAAVGMVGVPHMWTPPVNVKVDRPFLFLIQDTKSGLILFIGQVYNI